MEEGSVANLVIPHFVKELGGFCYTVLSRFYTFIPVKFHILNYKSSDYFHPEAAFYADKFPQHVQHLLYSVMNPRVRWNPEKLPLSEDFT